MKRISLWLLMFLLIGVSSAFAAHAGDTITVPFIIDDNSHNAVSARVGFIFSSDVFEFLHAEKPCPRC